MFSQGYRRYGEIENVPDRFWWCRYSRGQMQAEVVKLAGVTGAVYIDIECRITYHIPLEIVRYFRLSMAFL